LTRNGKKFPQEYIPRCKKNDIACRVKLADFEDNNRPERLRVVKQKDRQRLRKYVRAEELIRA
jgi:hypothetical protein